MPRFNPHSLMLPQVVNFKAKCQFQELLSEPILRVMKNSVELLVSRLPASDHPALAECSDEAVCLGIVANLHGTAFLVSDIPPTSDRQDVQFPSSPTIGYS
jgi:hypothetical protein